MEKNKIALLHPITESSGKKAIYVFVKVDGLSAPILEYTRFTKRDFRVCDMIFDDGRVPVAWCYAKDLMKLIGWERVLKNSSADIATYRFSVSLRKAAIESVFSPDSPDDGDDLIAHYSGFFGSDVIRGAVDADTMEKVKKVFPDLIET